MQQMSRNVVYASQAGARLDSDVIRGGGTDDTTVLQAVLDRAPELGWLHLIIDGAALVHGLNVHANTTIECPNPACGFFLADGANRAIIRNAHPSRDAIIDRNITLLGGTYNDNCQGQVHHTDDNQWVTAMDFFGIEQLTLRDIVIRDQRTFALFASNWRRVNMENISIILTERTQGNQDGLHFCGPGQFLTLRNIQGCSWDDFIALNADDGHTSYNEQGELTNNGGLGPYASFGPITDVLIDGVILDEAAQGIRFLSRTSRLDRVVVRNVIGTYRSFGFFMDPFWERGGNYGNIVFDTVDLRPLEPNFDYLPPFLFAVGGKFESLTINNLFHHNPTDNRRLIWVEKDADIGAITIDGLSITEADEQAAGTEHIIIDGHVERMAIHRAYVKRPAEAKAQGCLIDISEGDHPHGIDHLILDSVTTNGLERLLNHHGGTLGTVQSDNSEFSDPIDTV
ncbi:MAG TPA: hypothetical protein VHV83_00400 [Armatimonadota bacterium]|nr:hypothetical protein [Armatimonadota bacterium]